MNMKIEDFIKNRQIEKRAFINGEYVNSLSGSVISKKSSFNDMDLSGIAACDEVDVDRAVQCAKASFDSKVWCGKTPQERKDILLKMADIMESNKEELAILDTIETNRAYRNYLYDSIPKAIEAVRYFAEGIDKYYDMLIPPRGNQIGMVVKVPLGVVGVITPWNDPLVVAMWKVAPALLMGNSVIIKPAEQSSFSIIKLAEYAVEAGIPKGVFNVVPGYGEVAGKALAMHNDVQGVFFTGSSSVGKLIIQYAGLSNMKKVGLECGGKSPFIVTKNCKDIARAARILAENVFYNQGQICSAPSRVIVDKTIKEEFLDCLKEECEKFIPGNPYDLQNNVGCVVSREQFDKINSYLDIANTEAEEVYQAVNKKDILSNACCIQPTIISGISNQARVAQEEIFGPVVVVLEAEGIKEAVSIANDTKYGLAGAVFTDDINEAYYAASRIQAGLVHVNSYGQDDNMAPFGGMKESGLGKDKSLFAFNEYSELKTVWMTFELED